MIGRTVRYKLDWMDGWMDEQKRRITLSVLGWRDAPIFHVCRKMEAKMTLCSFRLGQLSARTHMKRSFVGLLANLHESFIQNEEERVAGDPLDWPVLICNLPATPQSLALPFLRREVTFSEFAQEFQWPLKLHKTNGLCEQKYQTPCPIAGPRIKQDDRSKISNMMNWNVMVDKQTPPTLVRSEHKLSTLGEERE